MEIVKNTLLLVGHKGFNSVFNSSSELLTLSYAQISLGKHSHTKKDLTHTFYKISLTFYTKISYFTWFLHCNKWNLAFYICQFIL